MSTLLAGAAKRTITPDEALLRQITEEEGKLKYDGIYEDIYVRAVVLSDGAKRIALIAVDADRFPDAQKMSQRLAEECGIDPMGCIFGATRNHQWRTVTVPEEAQPGRAEPLSPSAAAYNQYAQDRTVEAVQEAISRLEPALIGAAYGTSCLNANRNYVTPAGTLDTADPSGYSSKTLGVVVVKSCSGKRIALMVNYAMKGMMLVGNLFQGSFSSIGADLTGAISRYVERAEGDTCPVLWMAGGSGDQCLAQSSEVSYCGLDGDGNYIPCREVLPAEASFALMRRMAAVQGMDILRTADRIDTFSDEFDFFGAELWKEVPARIRIREQYKRLAPGQIPERVPAKEPLQFRMRLAVLNGIAFAGVNAELASKICTEIRDAVGCKTVLVLDGSYGIRSNVPDEDGDGKNGFSTLNSYCLSGAENERIFAEAFSELYRKYETRRMRRQGNETGQSDR